MRRLRRAVRCGPIVVDHSTTSHQDTPEPFGVPSRRKASDGAAVTLELRQIPGFDWSSVSAARLRSGVTRLRVVLSTRSRMERETGIEPATCSLEGRDGYA